MKNYPRPKNFIYDEVLYDDEYISIICGKYKDNTIYTLGMRWNIGESKLGYPSIFGKSMWMVVPNKIALLILNGLLSDPSQDIFFIRKDVAEKYLTILKEQEKNGE